MYHGLISSTSPGATRPAPAGPQGSGARERLHRRRASGVGGLATGPLYLGAVFRSHEGKTVGKHRENMHMVIPNPI